MLDLSRFKLKGSDVVELKELSPEQTRLTILWHLVRQPSFREGILPYAKSIGWWLPASGHAYATCGEVRAHKCDNVAGHPHGKVFVRYYHQSCRRRECPVCFEGWASAESERALIRFGSAVLGKHEVKHLQLKAIAENRGRPRDLYHRAVVDSLEMGMRKAGIGHVVVSPDPSTPFGGHEFKNLRVKAYSIAKRVGFRGGSVTFHPYRLHCRVCGKAIPEYQKGCLEHGSNIWWVPSPHFHMVGFYWLEHTKENYESTGWVVKNLGIRESVFWTMQYLLSHAGVFADPESSLRPRRFHSVTWIGSLSYRKLSGVPVLKLDREVCPYCGFVLMAMEDDELGRRPPPSEWVGKGCCEVLV